MSGYGNYGGQNPYGQAPAAEAGYSQPYSQYGQQTQNQYEMQPVGGYGNNHTEAPPAAAAAPRTLTQQDYLARVGYVRDQIRSLTADIEEVGALHQRALGSTDEQAARDRDNLVAATQLRNTEIRDQIRQLELDFAKTTDGTRATKKAQLESVRSLFKSELDRYQTIERDYQRRYRDQIKRQFRIAYPDASEQEVEEAAVQDWGNEGVFQNALRTNRGAQASSVLGNVRARHNELLRIEQTMNELALLSAEMAQLIEQQAPVVAAAEANAQDTVQNLQEGNKQVVIASKHARNRRKLKWWCLFITILIIAIAVGVGVGVYEANHKTT